MALLVQAKGATNASIQGLLVLVAGVDPYRALIALSWRLNKALPEVNRALIEVSYSLNSAFIEP